MGIVSWMCLVLVGLVYGLVDTTLNEYAYCYEPTEKCAGNCTKGWNNKTSMGICHMCCRLPNRTCGRRKVKAPGQDQFMILWPDLSAKLNGLGHYFKCFSGELKMYMLCSSPDVIFDYGMLMLRDLNNCSFNTTEILVDLEKEVFLATTKSKNINKTIDRILHIHNSVVLTLPIGNALLKSIRTLLEIQGKISPDRRRKLQMVAESIQVELSKILLNQTKSANKLTKEDVSNTISQMEDILQTDNLTNSAVNDLLDIADLMFNVSNEILVHKENNKSEPTSSRLVKIINTCGSKIADVKPRAISKTNFALASLKLINNTRKATGEITIQAKANNEIQIINVSENSENQTIQNVTKIACSEYTVDDISAILTLPASIFNTVLNEVVDDLKVIGVVYKNDHFFSINQNSDVMNGSGYENVKGQVLSAEIFGKRIKGLVDPVRMSFQLCGGELGNFSSRLFQRECGFWDTTTGNWSTEGLTVATSNENEVTCHSTHLTNFAVLFNSKPPENFHKDILNIITYVGLGVSLAGAFLTLITYAAIPSLRKNTPPKMLMNLCLALIILQTFFLVGIERRTKSRITCKATAVALQYSFLAVFFWNFVEGFHSVRGIAAPMKAEISKFLFKASVFAWGGPIVFTVVGIGVWTDEYGTETSCIATGLPFYFTILVPIALIFMFNMAALVVIMFSLKMERSKESVNVLNFQQRLRIAVVFMVLFGAVWVFGFFVINNDNVIFQYIFCALSSLQGFYIMLAYGLRNNKVRKYWLTVLHCKNLAKIQKITRGQLKGRTELTLDSTVTHSVSDLQHNRIGTSVKVRR